MKQLRQLLAMLLVLVMVLGVLPVQTFAEEETADIPTEIVTEELPEEAPAVEQTQPETVPEETEPEVIPAEIPEEALEEMPEEVSSVGVREMCWKNPLFADLDTPEFVDDGLIPVMPRAIVSPTEAVKTLKTKMIARTSKVVVETYFANDTSLTEEEFGYYLQYLWEYVLLSAMVHDGTPAGGDYLYWHVSDVDGEIGYDNSNSGTLYVQLTYKLTYTTTASQEKSVTSKVEEVLEDIITAGMTDYEKVKAIYDYIIGRVTYDDAAVDNTSDLLAHTAYGALVEGSAVCDGYAILFYRMCLEAGIDALMITGLADGDGDGVIDGAHAWNVVCIDGVYYNVDVTWDDAVLGAGYDYAYFLKCNDTFAYDHTRDDAFTGSNYNEDLPMATWDYPVGLIAFGQCGDNLIWILQENGTMTISGTGDMYDYASYGSERAPWYDFRTRVLKIVIENGATSIGANTFCFCSELTDVQIPESVTKINNNAFQECHNLMVITLPDGLEELGDHAFSGCRSITEITIPSGIETINTYTFSHCRELKTVNLPEGLLSIGANAFMSAGVEVIDLPDTVSSIGKCAFTACALKEINLPKGLISIDDYAFQWCNSLERIEIPEGVKTIGHGAFNNCEILKEAIVPGSVTEIEAFVFEWCPKLTDVTLKEGLTIIGQGMFQMCYELESIEIPDSIKNIGECAFLRCTKLEQITFKGDAPITIADDAFTNVVAKAYYPANNATWTESVMLDYGGDITWIASCVEEHQYKTVVTAPTCEEAGYTTHTCSACGDSYTDTPVDALGHNYESVVTPVTCTEDGYTTHTCTNCGDTYKDAIVEAAGHNFTEWADVDGITLRTCQNEGCGLVEYESCAKNLTTGKLYSDLSVALGEAVSGDTVVLLSNMDATAAPILVFSGVTLDLSGYSLKVNYLIGLKGSLVTGNVVDKNGENGGKLVVPQNGIVLPEAAPDGTAAGYKIIPVWNGDHYIFSQATISNQSFTVTGDTSKVMFLPNFSSYIKNSLFKTDGCEDNDVSVIISVSWMESGIWVTQEYFYTTSLIIDAMNNKSLYAYMTGCDTKEDLVFRIAIVTGSGAQVASQEYIYAEQ